MNNWDCPHRPTPLPQPELYDAASLVPRCAANGGATRETASCPACKETRWHLKPKSRHDLIWGKCLKATPPIHLPEVRLQSDPAPEVDVNTRQSADDTAIEFHESLNTVTTSEDQPVIAKVLDSGGSLLSPKDILREFPHARIAALTDAATWGSVETITDTDVPISSAEEFEIFSASDVDGDEPDGNVFEDDDDCIIAGGSQVIDQVAEEPIETHVFPFETIPEDVLDLGEADDDEVPKKRKLRRKRQRRQARNQSYRDSRGWEPSFSSACHDPKPHLDYVKAVRACEEGEEHMDMFNREALAQLIKEEGKRIVKPTEVRNSTGDVLQRWKTAAEAELSGNFNKMGAFHDSTPESWLNMDVRYLCCACGLKLMTT